MAWTNPKTWTAGETLTAANFNTHIRDNLNATGPHLIVRKTSDQSVTSSTALVNDSALLMNVAANEVWRFQIDLRYEGGGSGNLKISFGLPTSGRVDAATTCLAVSGSVEHSVWALTATDGTTSGLQTPDGAGAVRSTVIDGWFINAGTAGNYTLRWAQQTSNGTATIVKAQSTLWAVKLA